MRKVTRHRRMRRMMDGYRSSIYDPHLAARTFDAMLEGRPTKATWHATWKLIKTLKDWKII